MPGRCGVCREVEEEMAAAEVSEPGFEELVGGSTWAP